MIPPKSKLIPGYSGFYRADIYGNIWSCRVVGGHPIIPNRKGKWKKMNPSLVTGKKGDHLVVNLGTRPILVHRLVLEAFVGPCPSGMECRHFPDRTRSNNNLSNLQWGTPTQNNHDKVFHGTDNRGERCGSAKLTWRLVRKLRRLYSTGMYSYKDLARMFKMVDWSTIADAVRGRTWNHDPLMR